MITCCLTSPVGFSLLIFNPVSALIIQSICFYSRQRKLNKVLENDFLVLKTFKYGFIGLALSLAHTIWWMGWYEKTSGFSAGNAPLGWIFFSGPMSFSIGQYIALYRWYKIDL